MALKISPLVRVLLYLPAKLYHLGVRTRAALYDKEILTVRRLNTPVISVGNLTLGGTGKTPCVAFLANLLKDEGHEVAILSRGYKRSSRGRVEVSNGREILCGPLEGGDEPYLLAKSCPGVRVVVDADRYAAGAWLEGRAPVSVFILDDAFQHLRLARNLNLLLIDATERLDKAEMVPFGRLREPLHALRRADAIIVTRSDGSFDRTSLERIISTYSRTQAPVYYAHHRLVSLRRLDQEESILAADLAGRPGAAISGIARPERFIDDLSRLGIRIVFRRDFADHHHYTRAELLEAVRLSRAAGAEAIITTEKDAANMAAGLAQSSALPIYAAQIEFHCENREALKRLVVEKVTAPRS
jgi:tetraacyldisaccharide 4'-kinase